MANREIANHEQFHLWPHFFQKRLLLLRQNASAIGKGLTTTLKTLFNLLFQHTTKQDLENREIQLMNTDENIEAKGEIIYYEQFFLLPKRFSEVVSCLCMKLHLQVGNE